jgi:hypothetical protein
VAQGERQAAIAFLERMSRTNIAGRIELREWAAQLRRGVPPTGPSFDAAKVTLNTSGDRAFAGDPNARIIAPRRPTQIGAFRSEPVQCAEKADDAPDPRAIRGELDDVEPVRESGSV